MKEEDIDIIQDEIVRIRVSPIVMINYFIESEFFEIIYDNPQEEACDIFVVDLDEEYPEEYGDILSKEDFNKSKEAILSFLATNKEKESNEKDNRISETPTN